ncbi:MAG: hypothetical protein GY765_05545, partial [bacterium]|nr:hypothetical protein [bacterium]
MNRHCGKVWICYMFMVFAICLIIGCGTRGNPDEQYDEKMRRRAAQKIDKYDAYRLYFTVEEPEEGKSGWVDDDLKGAIAAQLSRYMDPLGVNIVNDSENKDRGELGLFDAWITVTDR